MVKEEFSEDVYEDVTDEQIFMKEPEAELINLQKIRDRKVGTFCVGDKIYYKILPYLEKKDFAEEVPQKQQICALTWAKGRIITEDMLGVMQILDNPEKVKEINPIYIEWLETVLKKEEEEQVTMQFEMDFDNIREVCQIAKLLPRDLFIVALENEIDGIEFHKLTKEELLQSIMTAEQKNTED